MIKLTFDDVCRALELSVPESLAGKAVTAVFSDTRNPVPGGLFVALTGERFDGNDFAPQAFESGAAAAVCSRPVPVSKPVFVVDDTRAALLKIASEYRRILGDIPVIGITGSVGKTTTKDMTACVMSAKYKTEKTTGNMNNEVGMPMTLLSFDEGAQAAVVEMGMNHAGEISRLTVVCRPTTAIITNIGTSHIGNLGSRENILAAKLEILEGMQKGSTLILNGDNDLLGAYANPDFNIIYYGLENRTADVIADCLHTVDGGTAFVIIYEGVSYEAFIPVLGEHNVVNALAAFTAGVTNGVDPQAAADALKNYKPTGLRQYIEDIDGITFIEDCYNASPDSVKANLAALVSVDAKRHIAVLGDMKELGDVTEEAHYECGITAAKCGVDILLCYGESVKDTIRGAEKVGIETAELFTDADAISKRLVEILKPGDAVLFKASRAVKLEKVIDAVKQMLL